MRNCHISSVFRTRHGFTILELLVAAAVTAVMLTLIATVVSHTSGTIKTSTEKVDAFQSARAGFETVTRTLGQATLNTYWDYYNSSRKPRTAANAASFVPALYGRQSDLHFLIENLSAGGIPGGWDTVGHGLFFQAPLGFSPSQSAPQNTLNATGFFVAFGNDPTQPALSTIADRPRFRLYQWLQNSADLKVDSTTGVIDEAAWILPTTGVRPVADNVVTFVAMVPETNSAEPTGFFWDSRPAWNGGAQPPQMHQLPPLVNITMVAVDEAVANRVLGGVSSAAGAYAALGLPSPKGLFTNAADYEKNLEDIEKALGSKGVPYRIFRSTVALPGSKWSP